MSIASHLSALEQKHRALEQEIEDELTHPAADDARIRELKRQKLKLKDQINRLKSESVGETLH